jgi:transcriptional regulator with XRE-family HTH domain
VTIQTSPSQQAKQALGIRLRDIRKEARLTARALAEQCGWHHTKVSKIEHAVTSPSDDDLEQWCKACKADDQFDDLKATSRAIESMYVEWRRAWRYGLRHNQQARNSLHEQTQIFRIYESAIIPGIFQTKDYATVVLQKVIEFNQVPNDLDEAVAARLERQRFLTSADRRFLIVLEEQALRTRVGSVELMQAQLERVLEVMALPWVSLGIIPSMAERKIWLSTGFWIFDQSTVRVETPSAELTITQRGEIAVFEKRFAWLQESARYGVEAREVVGRVMGETTREEGGSLSSATAD